MPREDPRPAIVALAWAGMLVWPAALALDLALALSRGWGAPGARGVVLGLGGLTLLVGASALFARGRRLWGRLAAPVVALLASLALALVAGEVVLGGRDPGVLARVPHLRPPGEERIFRPEGLAGVEGESRFLVNDHGVRGDPLPAGGVPRVLCVGGSTTECVYLDQQEAWPHLVQEALAGADGEAPIWVGNAGRSGFGTAHHLRFLEGPGVPDAVDAFVFLLGINDSMLFLRGFDFDGLPAVVAEAPSEPWILRLALVRQVSSRVRSVTEPAPDPDAEPDPELMEDERAHSYIARLRRRRRSDFVITVPDVTPALVGYRERLVRLVGAARARGGSVVLATQPVLWSADLGEGEERMLWMGRTTNDRFLRAADLRAGIERYNDVLVEVAEELEVGLVDLRPMSGDRTWFYDDCHFNEAGAREVARRVTPVLREVLEARVR